MNKKSPLEKLKEENRQLRDDLREIVELVNENGDIVTVWELAATARKHLQNEK